MKDEFTYKAGILIIGSLLWDNTHCRKPWREHYFGENYCSTMIDVNVPLRYGRYSEGRQCPAMVFSQEFYEQGKSGTGKFLPFRNQQQSVKNLICAAHALSEAEGSNSNDFIKGGNAKWCILVCWLNPDMNELKKNAFLTDWTNEYGKALGDDEFENFRMNSENETVFDEHGILKFKWHDKLQDFDVVLATQTQPRKCKNDRSGFLTPEEIAEKFFEKPEYFVKNKLHGIATFEDDCIINKLKEMDMEDFKKNALSNNCSEPEIDTFIKEYLFI